MQSQHPQSEECLIEGKYSIRDLLDMDNIAGMLEPFCKALGVSVWFNSHPCKDVLVSCGNRYVCTNFFHTKEESKVVCKGNNASIAQAVAKGERVIIKECPNGLVDGASPVLIRGQHVATLHIGPVVFSPTSDEHITRMATQYGFPQKEFNQQWKSIPQITPQKLENSLLFLSNMADMLAEQVLQKLQALETTAQLNKEISEKKLIEKQLTDTLEELGNIVENNAVGIGLTTLPDRTLRRANKPLAKIIGYDDPSEMIGKTLYELNPNREDTKLFDSIIKKLESGEHTQKEIQLMGRHMTPKWVNLSVSPLDRNIPPDLTKGVVGIMVDISQRKQAEEESRRALEKLQAVVDNSEVGILMLNDKRVITSANMRLAEILGYDSPDTFIGQSVEVIHLSSKVFKIFGQLYFQPLKHERIIQIKFRLRKKDGTPLWCILSGSPIDSNRPADLTKGAIWMIDDISSTRAEVGRLRTLATTDPLTGLPNRRYFLSHVDKEIAKADRLDQPASLLMIDGDHFKLINDSHGHHTGDLVLQSLAGIINSVIRGADVSCRIGGEEFAVFLPDTDLFEATRVAERIREKTQRTPIPTDNHTISFTVSIGVAALNDTTKNVHELLRKADKALYEAKEAGRDQVVTAN
ncbi:MAG: diguanylate cyclase [Desulfovibrio sp.]